MEDKLIQEKMLIEERKSQFYIRLEKLNKIIKDEINKLSIDSFCDASDIQLASKCIDALHSYFENKFLTKTNKNFIKKSKIKTK